MKKCLLGLLVLALAAGSGLFAQELVFKGDFRGGVFGFATNAKDPAGDATDPFIANYSTGNYAFRADLNGAYTNEAKNAGLQVKLRSELGAGSSATSPFKVGNIATVANIARLWLNYFDGKVTFMGGKLDNGGVLETTGGIKSSLDAVNGTGFFVQAAPIDNLVLGFGVYPHTSWQTQTEFQNANYRGGLTYTVPDTVKFIAVGAANGNSGDDSKAPDFVGNAILGIDVQALKSAGLSTLGLDVRLADFSDDVKNTLEIGERVIFVQDALEVGGRFVQKLALGDDKDRTTYAPDLYFQAWVSYKVTDNVVPRLDLGYDIGSGRSSDYMDMSKYTAPRISNDTWDGTRKGDMIKDAANLLISPSVEFRVGGSANQFIRLGYGFIADMTKDLADTYNDMVPTSYHVFQVEYKVSF
jgi:hypothetical protein